MKLLDLIKPLGTTPADIILPGNRAAEKNPQNPEVVDIAYDSRKVKPGFLFICLSGSASDGHLFARAAEESGAVAILAEHSLSAGIPVIVVPDTRKALALTSARLFGYPAGNGLQVIAVTGTKGKTTSAHMIQSILQQAGHRT